MGRRLPQAVEPRALNRSRIAAFSLFLFPLFLSFQFFLFILFYLSKRTANLETNEGLFFKKTFDI